MRSKTIIAATFGMDSAEMEYYRYQMTRTSKAIYAIGNAYYTLEKTNPKMIWVVNGNRIGISFGQAREILFFGCVGLNNRDLSMNK